MRSLSLPVRFIVTICFLFSFSFTIFSQQGQRPITWKDVPSWKSFAGNGAVLSPNGKWVAYGIVPVDGDGDLILEKYGDSVKIQKKYPVGGSSFISMAFSEDGRWIAFKEAAKSKDQKAAAKPGGRQVFDKLILIDLENDKKTEFEKVAGFSFNGKASTHLGITLAKERSAGQSNATSSKGGDFLLVELATGKSQNIGNVAEFSFNKAGDWLAYTIDATNQTGNGVHLLNVSSRQVTIIESDKASYQSLSWKEEGDAFALLKMVKDEKYKQDHGKVIGVKNPGSKQEVLIYDPQKDSLDFPKGNTISPNRSPIWTDDLTRILFGIHELQPVKKEAPKPEASLTPNKDSIELAEAEKLEKIKSDTSIKSVADLQKAIAKLEPKAPAAEKIDTVKPDMTIWHWTDKRLQSRQQVLQQQDKNFFYWGMYDVRSKKFTQLNDSNIRSLSPLPRHQYALATDISNYELDINLDGQNYQDIYVFDLQTGAKELVFEKFYLPSFSSYPRASPDGKFLLYGKDGHYHIYDIAGKTHTNLTKNIATNFVDTEDDHNVDRPLVGAIGWSADSKYVILRDLWEIWLVPTDGEQAAVNLTPTGRQNGIRYTMRYMLDPDEKGIDLTKPMYLRMYGEKTKKSGIGMITPISKTTGVRPGVNPLIWEEANVGRMMKAKNAEVFAFSRENVNKPTEFYVSSSPILTEAIQVTNNAPDAAKYAWSSGVRLVNYVSDKGDSLQGALLLPANYESGRKYPTLVYYYEKLSQTAHNWNNPGFSGTGWNAGMYTSNGYAVFIPDIVYKIDDPGMSAVWCVVPAVKEAIKTGVVDEERIGIHGHSWGGYQTSFLITQTNMFKAAAAGAPLTNMVSMYDLIYWNSGNGNMSIFEASQGRFKGGPWENWDAYLRNSPVYHVKKVETPLLMLHNDKDGAVDFTQGVEYYNALRRLKKPVVMIQYKGENHGLGKIENRKDYAVRMMEFFDHYLKGAPAPDWWKEGVDHLKLNEHLDKRVY